MKLLLVNNYANSARERALRLRSSFEKNGSTGTIVSWDSLASRAWKDFDGVVLSGSYDMLSEPGVQVKFSREVELARTSGVPLLGVCFGHQILGFAFGSPVIKAPRPSLGYREAQVLRKEPLFDDLGPRVSVYESHYEVVSSLPKEFVQSARSRGSEICAMQHSRLPLFGVQFHPERNSKEMPEGDKIISNFVHSVRASL